MSDSTMKTTAFVFIHDDNVQILYGLPNLVVGALVAEADVNLITKVGYNAKNVTLKCPKEKLEYFVQYIASAAYENCPPLVVMLATGDVDSGDYVIRASEWGWHIVENAERRLLGRPGFYADKFGLQRGCGFNLITNYN